MAFFKNFQQHFKQNLNLPSMSSLVDTLSNAVDDITSAVGDVSYTVADSITEQVTNMINILQTDDTDMTQDDKCMTGKEENSPQLSHVKEKHMREKGCNPELKCRQVDSLKQSTNGGREFHYNKDKMEHNLNAIEPNALLSDGEISKEVNNSIKYQKHDYLENATFSKNASEKCSTHSQEESVSKDQSKESHAVLKLSKDQVHENVKESSAVTDFKNTKEGHGVVSSNLETNENQTPKLSESKTKKVHGIPEIKEKCCRHSVTKQEENVASTVSKGSTKEKTKESNHFSKEVGSEKTPQKGEVSCIVFYPLGLSWIFYYILLFPNCFMEFICNDL